MTIQEENLPGDEPTTQEFKPQHADENNTKDTNDSVVVDVDTLEENKEKEPASNLSDTSDSSASHDKKTSHGTRGKGRPESGRDLGVWEHSLEDQSGCMSTWTLSFLTPLLSLGSRKVLDAEDIGVPSQEDRATRAYETAVESWNEQARTTAEQNEQIKKQHQAKLEKCSTDEEREALGEPQLKDPNIAKALIKAFGPWRMLFATMFYVLGAFLSFVPVLILNRLVRFFESGDSLSDYDEVPHPWAMVALLGIVPVAVSILQTRNQTIMAHCAVYVRTAVSTLLYRKSLRVSAAGRAKTSTGQVVNMMSNDTAQLQRFLQFLGLILSAPFQIILALVLIYGEVGNAMWVGVGYMFFLAPINTLVFSIVSKQRRKVLKYSDLRVKMMNEILSGIRIIKFYAWERPFGNEVGTLRQKELDALTKLAYTSAIGFSLILMSAPLIQPILVFITYVSIQDDPLTASTAFTTVALFNIMRFPFAFLPMGMLQYIQSRISLKRLERYLDLPELGEYVAPTAPPGAAADSPEAQEGSVTIVDGTFSWVDPDAKPIREVNEVKPKKERRRSSRRGSAKDSEMSNSIRSADSKSVGTAEETMAPKETPITLQNLTCTIEAGSLVAVVGEVGCGKSSFLSAILGEMESIHGSKIYVPRPSRKEESAKTQGIASITGEDYMSYCAQSPWVVNDTLQGNILFGREFDQERYDEVIEACALVDDIAVLPAGDMTEIGERGINLSGGQKARVSLARAFYSRNTKIMLMDDPLSAVDAHVGEHIFSNAINGPMSKHVTRVLVTHHVHLLSRCDKVIVLEGGRIKHEGRYSDLVANGVDFAGAVDVSKADESAAVAAEDPEKKEEKKHEKVSDEKKAAMKKSGKKLTSDEEKMEGSVAGSAYHHYAEAGGWFVAFLAIAVSGVGRASEVGTSFWLAHWANKSNNASDSGDPFGTSETNRYMGIYALLGVAGVLCLTLRAIVIAVHRLRASRKLHDELTESVIRAPVSFFDVTPIGRVLNRFAADMDKVDLEITQSLSQGISTVFNVLGALSAIVIATKGTLLGPLIPMGYVYYLIQKWFRKTSTELQRITSIANSPIFADFSQTLSGTASIRAYGGENRFFEKCKSSFDTMNASYVLVQITNSWLGLRLDVLGGLMALIISAIAVGTYEKEFIPAEWLGLALSFSIEVSTYLKHGVRMIATIEAQMNSVERVLYYTNNIEPEADEFVPEHDPDEGTWPSLGEIEFQDTSMRYRDGPLVLKDISLKVKGGERIGVAGRTGSGKSSMMISLFRISEVEEDGGKILIDGVDISKIGISTLRSNISIIPQDPVVFSNTVRYNLDPFRKATDEEIWATLQKVQMDEVIAQLPDGLEEQVAEGGENFSQGQRQLLCIARSLLRHPKILVMDEATASIDNATDAAIQKMIRENFEDATVLTIAHRLNTIMDSDRVLILDDGRIAEYDSPQVLLNKDGGLFRGMVEKSQSAKEKGQEL
mmetsp:Transcript_12138/g.26798  ORF Transcript_12138/g.26798 Transcript_12138/m.26798 type:complete len:1473 (-) Transcript_12138:29-4447(-)|eukprot:CAMPEP_0168732008 /NCGR_PEP_ID=MMETSP0724-20121128/7554_1 /TAXON_ID=265536 /ORGANISM="Amphiprora sp., Strain CCMP467" /LENGTH=1472 /DNA_ID=CAMNT_0008779023 /DNA_START=450 /DNA_END=4868 /DNA_ORIENTATION=+